MPSFVNILKLASRIFYNYVYGFNVLCVSNHKIFTIMNVLNDSHNISTNIVKKIFKCIFY